MNELDDELRRVLRREDPPAGFAERVMERVNEKQPACPERVERVERARLAPAARPWVMRWAAAAVLVAALGGGYQYRAVQKARDERARGEAAKEQVMQALRLAGAKLQLVQATVKEIGS